MAKKMTTSYEVAWKSSSRYRRHDVKKIHAELERIRKSTEGAELHPGDIIEAAKSSRSVLHKLFEWDDTKAAHQHRLYQAGTLIRSIVVHRIDHPEKGNVREYTVTPGAYAREGERRPFRRTEDLLADEDLRPQVLQRALGELVAFQRRYKALQELAIVMRSIDEVLTTVKV